MKFLEDMAAMGKDPFASLTPCRDYTVFYKGVSMDTLALVLLPCGRLPRMQTLECCPRVAN